MTTPPLKLYPFQEGALRISKQKWDEGVTRQLLALPTGTGKTCIFASLPLHHKFQNRMLVLVHREELANQADRQCRLWNRDAPLQVGVEMGNRESTRRDKVVIASVQSLAHRLYRFPPSTFDVIVCDEAHHSAAPSYLRVFDHFGLRDPDNKKLLLGVTATPFRADNKELIPGVYEEIIYEMPLLQAIEDGWLCDLRSFRIEKTGTDLDRVITRANDFAEDQLENAIDNPIRTGLIAKECKRLAGSRRTIVFAVTVKHAQNLAAAFRDYGVTAKAVWGEDPERRAKIKEHEKGVVQVLCNCAILTEGYDDWRIECIVMARPTLSRVLFRQMIGRGTRIEKGLTNLVEARRDGLPISKPECIIIDVVDNTKKHNLVTLSGLFNSKIDFHGKSLTEIRKQAKPGEISNPYLNSEELQKVERTKVRIEEVDLFRGARQPDTKAKNLVRPLERPESAVPAQFCLFCGEAIAEGKLLAHLKDCPRRPVTCQYCNLFIRSRQWLSLEQHVRVHGLVRARRTHPRSVHCPYCHQAMRRAKLNRHIKEKCPRRPSLSRSILGVKPPSAPPPKPA